MVVYLKVWSLINLYQNELSCFTKVQIPKALCRLTKSESRDPRGLDFKWAYHNMVSVVFTMLEIKPGPAHSELVLYHCDASLIPWHFCSHFRLSNTEFGFLFNLEKESHLVSKHFGDHLAFIMPWNSCSILVKERKTFILYKIQYTLDSPVSL
jgi:hypothetical protein